MTRAIHRASARDAGTETSLRGWHGRESNLLSFLGRSLAWQSPGGGTWGAENVAQRGRLLLWIVLLLPVLLLLTAACSDSDSGVPTSDSTPTNVPSGVAADGDSVAVHYHGTLDDGEVFDSSRERDPLVFTVGTSQVIKGFDDAVRGLKVGESVTVRMEPEDAYGEWSEARVLDFPIAQLPAGSELGGTLYFQGGGQGTILSITDEGFKVDANHALAGKALTFEIELVSIR